MTEETFRRLLTEAHPPFYNTWDFWIFLILAIAGVLFSILAYVEAARAKVAAKAAGRSVKIQTVTIELTEILQRLDKLDDKITFPAARDLLAEVSRRLLRLVGPLADGEKLKSQFDSLKEALKAAKAALEGVRPDNPGVAEEPPQAVYYGLQGHFGTIGECVAEISGTLEKQDHQF